MKCHDALPIECVTFCLSVRRQLSTFMRLHPTPTPGQIFAKIRRTPSQRWQLRRDTNYEPLTTKPATDPLYPRLTYMLLKGHSLRTILASALLLAGTAFSKTQAINGSIRGRVTDATSAPVPGAKIDSQRQHRLHAHNGCQ